MKNNHQTTPRGFISALRSSTHLHINIRQISSVRLAIQDLHRQSTAVNPLWALSKVDVCHHPRVVLIIDRPINAFCDQTRAHTNDSEFNPGKSPKPVTLILVSSRRSADQAEFMFATMRVELRVRQKSCKRVDNGAMAPGEDETVDVAD